MRKLISRFLTAFIVLCMTVTLTVPAAYADMDFAMQELEGLCESADLTENIEYTEEAEAAVYDEAAGTADTGSEGAAGETAGAAEPEELQSQEAAGGDEISVSAENGEPEESVDPEGAEDTEGAEGDTNPEDASEDTNPEGAAGDTNPEGAEGDTNPEGAAEDTNPAGDGTDKTEDPDEGLPEESEAAEELDSNEETGNDGVSLSKIVANETTMNPVTYSDAVSEEDKERIEQLMSKFSMEATIDPLLPEMQITLAQLVLGLTDEEMQGILENPDQHIEISLVFEAEVIKADFSDEKSPVIEYSLNTVATAKLYDATAEDSIIKAESKVLAPADFNEAQVTLTVTMPLPEGCTPTAIRHTSDDGSVVYEEINLDECTINTEENTVTVNIPHCSHLVAYFGLGNDAQDPVAYMAPQFIDEEHPEKGMVWNEMSCSDYTVVSDSDGKVECTAGGWYVIKDSIQAKEVIIGAEGITTNVILCDGAKLEMVEYKSDGTRGITTLGTVNFYGQEGGTGTIISKAYFHNTVAYYTPGIGSTEKSSAATLNFYGGVYDVEGYANSGIGFALKNSHTDIVTIYGGTITATGGGKGPGICTAQDSTKQGVTIYGGNITANGSGSPGIGAHADSDAYNITIYGGNITANGGDCAAGIGSASDRSAYNIKIYGGNVTAVGGRDSAGIGGGYCGSGYNIVIAGDETTEVTAIAGGLAAGIGGSYKGECENITISGGTVKATGKDAGIGGVNAKNITISGGIVEATATEAGAGIGTFREYGKTASNIRISGGTVTAIGSDKAPGIGASQKGTTDGIYISGGTVIAKGGKEGAGIGGAYQGTVKNIEISQASDEIPTIVTATGGSDAAGIGGGKESSASGIKISGGTVTATGGSKGAGIGGGYSGDGTDITISGGTVTATGGIEAAGIGGSYKHKGENITISGGSVTAAGGQYAAGIGGGKEGYGNLITITGGVVEAKGSAEQGAGIGGGDYGAGLNIVISGGRVKATGVNGSAGIGGGRGAVCDVTISGGYVEAQGGYWGPAIGSGANCTSGSSTIKISNASVYCHKVAGGGYPAIGIGPFAGSKVTCSVTVSGENTIIWNMDTNTAISNNGGNLSGKLGDASIMVTNGAITAKGATMNPVTYSDSLSEADKERIEQLMTKFSMKATGDLALLETQFTMAQSILGLTDDQMLDILADPDQHIEMSLVFEAEVIKADFSNEKSPVIEYALNTVAIAKLYDADSIIKTESKVMLPSDFNEAKANIEVTMPLPEGYTPTLIRHTSNDGSIVYEEINLDECTINTEENTVTVNIPHCSHLVAYFEQESTPRQVPKTGDDSMAGLYMGLLMLSALAAAFCVVMIQRKRHLNAR